MQKNMRAGLQRRDIERGEREEYFTKEQDHRARVDQRFLIQLI